MLDPCKRGLPVRRSRVKHGLGSGFKVSKVNCKRYRAPAAAVGVHRISLQTTFGVGGCAEGGRIEGDETLKS